MSFKKTLLIYLIAEFFLSDNSCPYCDVKIVEKSQIKRHIERVSLSKERL